MTQEPHKPRNPRETQDVDKDFRIRMAEFPRIGSAEAMRMERELQERLRMQGPRARTLKPLALFYARTGNQEKAYHYLKQWMKRAEHPEALAECLLMCGQLAEQVDQVKSAIAFYREALDLSPKHPQVRYFLHNNLAYCLNRLAEYKDAEAHGRHAAEIDPSRANAFKNIGTSLAGLGRYAEAARVWLQALHVDASDPRALEQLEDLYAAQGDKLCEAVPDFAGELERARRAVKTARTGRFGDWARGVTLN